jgi:hypothetical protein
LQIKRPGCQAWAAALFDAMEDQVYDFVNQTFSEGMALGTVVEEFRASKPSADAWS